jgi:hypothetical protein
MRLFYGFKSVKKFNLASPKSIIIDLGEAFFCYCYSVSF